MEFYSESFFCNKDKGGIVHVDADNSTAYPISVHINNSSDTHTHPRTTIYLSSEADLIHFVNSVKSSYNEYRRKKGYDK